MGAWSRKGGVWPPLPTMAVFFTYSFFTHLQFSDHQFVRSVEYLNQNSIDLKPLDLFDLYPVPQDLLNFLHIIDWLLSFHYYQSRSVYQELTKPWKIKNNLQKKIVMSKEASWKILNCIIWDYMKNTLKIADV